MPRNATGSVVREGRTLHRLGRIGDRPDEDLLDQFVHGEGEERELAFAAIIDRHGPMVLRVCGDLLNDHHEAQDAAQATFLVLATRARTVRRRGSLGPWLFGVARRISARAAAAATRRHRLALPSDREPIAARPAGLCEEDAQAIHEEIDALPARYRAAIVACDLQGLSHAAAASQLALPLRTLQTRLYRGRDRLRSRLVRRGVVPGTTAIAAFTDRDALAAPHGGWVEATSRAAVRIADGLGGMLAPLASTRALAWAKTWCRSATLARVAVAAVVLCTAGFLLGGSIAHDRGQQAEPRDAPAAPPAAATSRAGTAIARPLQAPDELRGILREVAREAVQIARTWPDPGSWALAKVASAQAKTGDLPGAKATFLAAVEQAGAGGNRRAEFSTLRYIGLIQAECGMYEEARAVLRKALDVMPEVTGDFNNDNYTLTFLCMIANSLARSGDREHAREAVQRLDRFADEVLKKAKPGNRVAVILPGVAAAHAATGDFDGAFATIERLRKEEGGLTSSVANALGEILERTRYLKPLERRRFVRHVAAEIEPMRDASETYFVLSDLAEAQARIGEIEAARKSALAIGEGRRSMDYDMTDGQPYALLRVALVQKESGDLAGARETLRLGYDSVRSHPNMRGPSGRLGQIASGQLAVGDIVGAVRTAASIEQGDRAETLAFIALAQAIAGRHESAEATLKKAMLSVRADQERPQGSGGRETPVPDASERSRMRATLQSMSGDVDRALATARSITDAHGKQWALAEVVKCRAQAGDLRDALALARGLDAVAERREAFQSLADGLSARLELEKTLGPRR